MWAVVMLAAALPATAPTAPTPPVYRCVATTAPVTVDGKLDEAAWSAAEWTSDFGDVVGGPDHPAPPLRTRAKLLWDDRFLYVAAEMSETEIHAEMRERDMPLFREGAFELFLDPDDDGRDYLELEVNALSTVFDLIMDKPYRDGGKSDSAFDVEGLKSAVHVDGTLNDDSDRDRGWTMELAIPWAALQRIGVSGPPKAGARWRMEMGRAPGRPRARFSTWSPHGRGDMHMPEKWGYVEFAPAP
jgi:hypothetical protein